MSRVFVIPDVHLKPWMFMFKRIERYMDDKDLKY